MLMHSATACSQSLEDVVVAGEIPRSAMQSQERSRLNFRYSLISGNLNGQGWTILLTVEHVLDGADGGGGGGEGGRELLAEVVKAVEVVGEADALALRLGQQALAKLYVGSVIRVISASFVF